MKSCCAFNEYYDHFPIIIEIVDPNLKEMYKGNFLLQIWSSVGEKKYERVLRCKSIVTTDSLLDEPQSINVFSDVTLFRLDSREQPERLIFIIYMDLDFKEVKL